jgi:hypothetical protein
MIEAMACGTPVIAFRSGSVPEVVEEGVSGFVVETVNQAVAAVARVASLNRANVRAAFEHRFTIERAACDYLQLYQQVISSHARSTRFRKANGENKREATLVPGPPIAIDSKKLDTRRRLPGKVLDSSTTPVVEPRRTSLIPNGVETPSKDGFKRRKTRVGSSKSLDA